MFDATRFLLLAEGELIGELSRLSETQAEVVLSCTSDWLAGPEYAGHRHRARAIRLFLESRPRAIRLSDEQPDAYVPVVGGGGEP